MGKNKKLFNSEDFDKRKPLFESEDFDKTLEIEDDDHKGTRVSSSGSSKSNSGRIIGALIAVAIIAVGLYFFIRDKANKDDVSSAVVIAKQEIVQESDYRTSESQNKTNDISVDEASIKESELSIPTMDAADSAIASVQPKPSSVSGQTKSVVSTNVTISGSVEENARRVIRGDFGNGQERKVKLGASYAEIQSKVNEMYRQGLVH